MADRATLFERERELAALTRLLNEDRSDGAAAVVAGPAGIGKTALLQEARAIAERRGFQVAAGRAGELERDLPFALVQQAFLGPVSRDREGLLTGPAAAAGPALGVTEEEAGGVERTVNGLWWLCADLAARQPLLLVLDDLHWADAATLRWVDYLARRLDGLALVLLIGTRLNEPGTDPQLLNAVLSSVSERLEPEPLTKTGVEEVLADRLGEPVAPRLAAACHEATRGNPFYIATLTRELSAGGAERLRDPSKVVEELGAGAVGSIALVRMGRAHPAAPVVAQAAAVLGGGAPVGLVAELTDQPVSLVQEAADALRLAGVLDPGAALDFVHPLLRSAVNREIAPGKQSELHARAADLLRRGSASADVVASHLLHVAPAGDAGVVDLLREGARTALARGAPASAMTYLSRALREPARGDVAGEIYHELARAEILAGHDGSRSLDAAVEATTDPAQRLALLVERVSLIINPSRLPYEDALERALREAPDAPEPVRREAGFLLAEIKERAASGNFMSPRVVAATLPYCEDIESLPPGRLRLTLRARLNEHHARTWSWEEAMALEAALVDDEVPDPDDTASFFTYYFAVWCLLGYDHVPVVEAAIERLFALARARGSEGIYADALILRCAALTRWGSLREAVEAGEEALARRDNRGAPGVPMSVRALGAAYIARGDPDATDAFLRTVPEPADGAAGYMDYLEIRGRARLLRDDYEGIDDLLGIIGRNEDTGYFCQLDLSPAGADLIPALAASGRRDEAVAWAEAMVDRHNRFGCPSLYGMALTALARVQEAPRAFGTFESAAAALAASPRKYELARALTYQGAALRRAGLRREAREPLRRALDLALAVHADAVANFAREELGATGARARRERLDGVDALTPAELRVARLAAEGRSNREIAQDLFLSPKTVEMHLGRVYRKLGVRRGPDLVAALGMGMLSADGTSTIVFTDLVESTRLTSAVGDAAWLELLSRHEREVRDAVREHRGSVVKRTGDGFILAFASVVDAVACSIAIRERSDQREHGTILLRIRIGVHTGTPTPKDGDLYGEDVNYAARVGAAAAPGELLVSEAVVRDLNGARMIEIGEPVAYELKGFAGSQRLYPVLTSRALAGP